MRVLAVSAEVISVKECKFPEHKGNAQAPDDLPVCGLDGGPSRARSMNSITLDTYHRRIFLCHIVVTYL